MMTERYGRIKNGTMVAILMLAASLMIPIMQTAFAWSCEENGCIQDGKMTGGGRINANMILTHGFELNCNPSDGPNNLEINYDKGNSFHLESVTYVHCFDDPAQGSGQPKAGFDTLEMSGFGRLNGQSGAFVWVQFTDYGEPGKNDWSTVVIYDNAGNLKLDVTGVLTNGNHQAHE